MKKRKTSSRARSRNRLHLIYTLLALTLGLSCHSCADLPSGHELEKAGTGLEAFVKELGTAVREHASVPLATIAYTSAERTADATESFATCQHFFAAGKPPVVAPRPTHRALCYDAFAILHSGESKTAVFVAQKLNRASVLDADEERKDKFFADARLPSAERATLADYIGSGMDKGHLAPAADMPTVQAMAQSFSLANMVPQAQKHNRGAWARSVELATRKYAGRASGNVYVITGPIFEPSMPKARALVRATSVCPSTYSSSYTTKTRTGRGHTGISTTTAHALQNQSAMANLSGVRALNFCRGRI